MEAELLLIATASQLARSMHTDVVMALPTIGSRFKAKRDVIVKGRIEFGAPFDDSFEGTLPEGEIVIFEGDTGGYGNAYLRPEKYDYFEKVFIPEFTRRYPDYGNYTIVCSYDNLKRDFEFVEGDWLPD